MIVCRSCGGHNADGDTFCGSCGEFLEWTGEKVGAPSESPITMNPPPAAAEPKPADAAPTPAYAEPKPAVAAPTPTVAAPTPTPTVAAPKPAVVAPTSAVAAPKPAVEAPKPAAAGFKPAVGGFAPAVGAGPTGKKPEQRPAAALVAPVPPPRTGSSPALKPPTQTPIERKPQPQEVLPQQPVRRRPTAPELPSPPTRQLQPDDLICGMCGEGNPPTRRFCSRCGESLQIATVAPTPWWRKLLRLFERKLRPAGSRPKRRPGLLTARGVLTALRRVLIVALLLFGLLYAVFPSMRSLVNGLVVSGKDKIESMFVQQYVPVRPIQVTATGEVPGHLAPLASDGFTNTFWAAPDAAGQPSLVLEFDRPTDLVRAIVHNGGGAEFQALGRPRDLHLVYIDGERTIGASDVLLTDTPEEQQVEFSGGNGATRVEVHVMSVYSSLDNPGLALSEIELFERQ